jgi:GLPGLI family protein
MLFVLCALYISIISASAQIFTPLDTVVIRCQYQQSIVQDITKQDNKENILMVLQIGKSMSKFFTYGSLQHDSVYPIYSKKAAALNDAQAQINVLLSIPFKELSPLIIFKGFPEGKITCLDRFSYNPFKYVEDYNAQTWILKEGNATICGYACKKAETDFRGRRYIAWYAPDIPISEGPWKFNGLPGLILKVEDTKQEIAFVCVSIIKPTWIDNIYYRKTNNVVTLSRQQYEQEKKKYMASPGAYVNGNISPGLLQQNELSSKAYEKRPYNPIELDVK